MAEKALTTVWTEGDRNGITTWDAAAFGDTYTAYQHRQVLADITFGVEGLANTTVQLHGSNNGVDFYQLKDLDGVLIALTADGLAEVRSAPPYFKPVNSGGSDAAIICILHTAKVYA